MRRSLDRFAWGIAIVSLLMFLVWLDRTPLPWYDEVLWASSSRSILLGHHVTPSVLDGFPGTGRFDLFYGSVPFQLGALMFRLFGLSITAWRLLGWAATALLVLITAQCARYLSANSTCAAVCAALVSLTPAVGARATSGRMDTLTLALELASLVMFARVLMRNRWIDALGAGLLLGASLLTTPRALLFAAGFGAGLVLVLFTSKSMRADLKNAAVFGLSSLFVLVAWTTGVGLGLFGWLHHISAASRGDSVNMSPLLGGSWGNLAGSYNFLADSWIILVTAGMAIFVALRIRRNGRSEFLDESRILWFATAVVVTNAVLNCVLLSRVFSYEIFWLTPLISVLLAWTWILLREGRSVAWGLATAGWVLMIVSSVAVRGAKTVEVAESWRARDPQLMTGFVKSQIPSGSVVFGPISYYFYAVEQSGSRYLLFTEETTPGLKSSRIVSLPEVVNSQAAHRVYLLWPKDSPLPEALTACLDVQVIAHYTPASGPRSFVARFTPYSGGYPATDLLLIRPQARGESSK